MSTVQTTNISRLITSSPNVSGGRARITGTGVTVQRIIGWYKLGRSPEEIVDTYGHITLAHVYAALAYYHANREALEAQFAADETESELLEREWREATGKEQLIPASS